MPEQLYLGGNLIIMVAYMAIMMAIVVPVNRAGQLRTNKLAVATAMIFFSCAVGHGLHALMTIRGAGHGHSSASWLWATAIWDAVTAMIGIYYWTLRRGYAVLLGPGAIYVDPWGQHRLDEASAREQAAVNEAAHQQAILATVVDHIDDAIIGLSPRGTVTAWNRGAEKLFGLPARETLGAPVTVLNRPDELLDRIRSGATGLHDETDWVREDGATIRIAVDIAPICDAAGELIGASVVARNITAAMEAAEQQRAMAERSHQAQRMESLGKLAGGVAHDFNNILAIIQNYTEFAAEMCEDKPEVRADLAHVTTAAERATNLTRQLLTFTRGDAVQPQDMDLNPAVAEVEAMLARTIGEDITLIAVPSGRPIFVHADPGQIQQVLLNLAINARDAMPDGGTLVLEVNTATLGGDEMDMQPPLPAGVYARILVSDTGEGIPPEVAERIFEPFFTTKPHGKGTGLGLATVYGIVAEAGGGINLYSEQGIGTTFRIYLPLVPEGAAPHTPAARITPADGAGRTVLVVEDEPALARVVTRILAGGGYRVVAVNNGPEALDAFGTQKCDVLLTDVIMPEISGPRLVELLHERRPDLPVLYMSGYSNGLLGTTHILDDDIAFIEKPFTGQDLLLKLGDVLIGVRSEA
ncbi:PAS domain S-box-containing protein [Actinoplanes lutulentus]|uniref:histidine kinase n=1 Tax=Actinoplanes lutulentus TaxID=1287878 RepID=A0A327Z9L8_9ACTN|nr:PAS domain-containing hybrid sensor histidine kinase/response regulator [Actinoplanes lutulentus]MBB2948517.1 PAS domain S-box-containing protein [Actinoplanes lutulentus]RAK34451.1 PAS domain S-box-containing protein [Actinoplanes lutulentus]